MKIENFKNMRFEIGFERACEKNAKQLAENLKTACIEKYGEWSSYANGWTMTKKSDRKKSRYVVHNKDEYRLTHLLEKGHVIRNEYGTYGKTKGNHMIKDEFDKIKDDFIKDIEQAKIEVIE